MELVLKIYQNQSSTLPLFQITNIINLTIDEDINWIWTCKIEIPASIPNIAQNRKIEVCEVKNWVDTRLFLGYIDNFDPNLRTLELNCKSEKSLLARKPITTARSFTGKTLTEIMTTLLNDWFTFSWEQFTFSTSIWWTMQKTLQVWDNLYDILEEITWNIWAIWTCNDMNIKAELLLWTDYTQPLNFKELVFDLGDPRSNNVIDIKRPNFWTLANIIIWEDWATKIIKSDATSITENSPLFELKSFRPWDLANQTQKYLDSKKNWQFAYIIEADWFKFDCNVWDKVHLRVENVSDYFNYIWDVIINTKKTEIVNWTKQSLYWVSDSYVYFDSFTKRFLWVEKAIDLKLIR